MDDRFGYKDRKTGVDVRRQWNGLSEVRRRQRKISEGSARHQLSAELLQKLCDDRLQPGEAPEFGAFGDIRAWDMRTSKLA